MPKKEDTRLIFDGKVVDVNKIQTGKIKLPYGTLVWFYIPDETK